MNSANVMSNIMNEVISSMTWCTLVLEVSSYLIIQALLRWKREGAREKEKGKGNME